MLTNNFTNKKSHPHIILISRKLVVNNFSEKRTIIFKLLEEIKHIETNKRLMTDNSECSDMSY